MFEASAIAANAEHTLRYRAAYEEQVAIHDRLVAEAGRLAEEIEARFSARWPCAAGPERDASRSPLQPRG